MTMMTNDSIGIPTFAATAKSDALEFPRRHEGRRACVIGLKHTWEGNSGTVNVRFVVGPKQRKSAAISVCATADFEP
jgi:hypothetical protein